MTITKLGRDGAVITGESIKLFKMVAQRGALKLEIFGMKRRGTSAFAIIKEQYGLTGDRVEVLKKLEALIAMEKERLGVGG